MNLIAYLIATIRNYYSWKLISFKFCYNLLILRILKCLLDQRFISNFVLLTTRHLCIYLHYNGVNQAAIRSILLISKPSNRVYWSLYRLKYYGSFFIYKTTGLFLLSTNIGLLWHPLAVRQNKGGEVLFFIT